jgi:hypothetical protein
MAADAGGNLSTYGGKRVKHRYLRLLAALPLAAVLLFQQPAAAPITAHASLYSKMLTIQKRILSGVGTRALVPSDVDPSERDTAQPNTYYPTSDDGCPLNLGNNIKVNQNCLNLTDVDLQGRAQAQNETSISHDPNNPQHLVASYNDYRRGDGNCYSAYSLDGGKSWSDSTIPMSFTRGTPPLDVRTGTFGSARQYWQAGGDTSVAWDTRGNAYLSCQVFERGKPSSSSSDVSSAFLVFRSTLNKGASWNFPGRYVRASAGVTDAQAAANPFLDKQLITVDNHVGSPYQDRVYVSWTEFAADNTAFIYEAFSSDYGQTFSAKHLVSGNNTSLCTNDYGIAGGGCNQNQFSQPITAPDGTLYVVFNNYNNEATKGATADNRNQILVSKSTDGGQTFGVPVKVADYYDLPDCLTYQGQDPGRACVPEKGSTTKSVFRAANYPSGSVDPRDSSKLVVTFGSYINKYSNETNGCTPAGFSPATGQNLFTGVKEANGCANKILVSVSTNAGTSFTGTTTDPRALTTVNQRAAQRKTDQWWQWQDFTRDGRLAVSYYDRQYGNDEVTGFSDFSLSGSRDLVHFGTRRVTSSSLPPPTQFSGTFWGDYTGLTAPDKAYPLWSDTRPTRPRFVPDRPPTPRAPTTRMPSLPPSASRCREAATMKVATATTDGATSERPERISADRQRGRPKAPSLICRSVVYSTAHSGSGGCLPEGAPLEPTPGLPT